MLTITDMKMEKGGVLSFTVDANVASAVQCSVRNAHRRAGHRARAPGARP